MKKQQDLKSHRLNIARIALSVFLVVSVVILSTQISCRSQSTGKTYNLEISNPEDATVEIYNAIQKCRDENYSRLVIKKGVYHLRRTRAFEKYVSISNCDNGMKRIAFPLDNFSDFEVDGGGSMFICHGRVQVFELENTKNITLRNFSVDWEKPFYYQAEVIKVDPENNSYDIKEHHECDSKIVNNELLFYDSNMIRAEDQWLQDINWSEWFDPATGGVALRSPIYEPKSAMEGFKVTEIDKGVYRLQNAARNLPELGWVLICKGIRNNNTTNRSASVIHIYRSENIRTVDVTIHTCSGIGFVAERSTDIFIDRMRVELPEGSERMVTTTADATHFVNCKGRVEIKDSYFENVLDDITNIHGDYASILDVIDSHTIGVELTHQHQLKVEIAGEGDIMRIVNGDMENIVTRRVKSVDYRNSVYIIIEFEEEVESLIGKEDYWIENLTWNSDFFLVKNCIVKNNRGRAVCVSDQGKVIIEDCTFENNAMPAVRLTGDLRIWWTSSPVTDVLIQNNTIISYSHYPAVTMTPQLKCDSKPNSYYNSNVRVLNNTIESSTSAILYANHIENLEFSGNRIIPLESIKESVPANSAFNFKCVKNVRISDNISERRTSLEIQSDQFSEGINVEGNTGIDTDIKQ
jgi:hypothetical protein